MKKDTHRFIHEYTGIGAMGFDRKTDEQTLMYYLQKFSEDNFLSLLLPRLSDEEISEIYEMITKKLRLHLSENEYHRVFLKDK